METHFTTILLWFIMMAFTTSTYFPEDNGSCSMRYKSGIVVSVTLILEAFEYVAFKVAFDYRTSAWKLCSFPCFTLVVDIVP
jgi:hypothetical protein